MADNLARAKLARAASRLNAQVALPRPLPALVLLTDDDRLADAPAALRKLPRGSLVIVRARDPERRAELSRATAAIARTRSLIWLVAGDPELASRARADGVHFSEAQMARASRWRARRPNWLITCSAHSGVSCARAGAFGADAAILAPVFATASHPGRAALGSLRVRFIARMARVPIYALGGIDARTALRLRDSCLAGLAAVSALAAGDSAGGDSCVTEPGNV